MKKIKVEYRKRQPVYRFRVLGREYSIPSPFAYGRLLVRQVARFSKRFKLSKPKYLVLVLFCLALLTVLVTVKFLAPKPAPEVLPEQQSDEGEVITFSTDKPDEVPPGEDYVWRGKLTDPRYIRLPSIGVEGFIQKVGIDQHKNIAVPNNVHIAGWYVNTSVPGEPGLSIIDGHVDGYATAGIFRNLKNLKQFDDFEVELGNGALKKYKVMKVKFIDKDIAVNQLFSQNPKVKSQLNLITCGGNFDKTTGSYEQRIIVTAELVE